MKSIYEKCCETFAQSAQYKSDQRFLLIWLYYVFKLFVFMIDQIDLVKGDIVEEIFSYMIVNEIGTTYELFYLAQTTVYEQNCNYIKTEDAYQQGFLKYFFLDYFKSILV